VESGLAGGAPLELGGADEVQRRVAPDGVVEAVDVTARASRASALVWNTVRQTSSLFNVLKKVSTIEWSKQFPFPDIEIRMPWRRSSAWYSIEQIDCHGPNDEADQPLVVAQGSS